MNAQPENLTGLDLRAEIDRLRRERNAVILAHYYQDEEIKQVGKDGRRLFTGTEFNKRTGRHESEQCYCMDRNKIGKFTIIDDQVFRLDQRSEENIAMTKNQFADCVLEGKDNFGSFDLSSFIGLFELIEIIANRANP